MTKKQLLSCMTALSLAVTPLLRAEVDLPTAEATTEETPPVTVEPTPKAPVQVGKGAADGASTSRHKNLGNVTIAVLAIAVAATAIILVSRHEGKHT